MERGRKQIEEMMLDCSMHAAQRRGKHNSYTHAWTYAVTYSCPRWYKL